MRENRANQAVISTARGRSIDHIAACAGTGGLFVPGGLGHTPGANLAAAPPKNYGDPQKNNWRTSAFGNIAHCACGRR